jgi:integrase
MTRLRREPIREVNVRGRKRYRVVIDAGPDANGKRRQVTSTHDTLAAARSEVARVSAERAAGTFIARDSRTIDMACEEWIASRTDIRDVTRQGYRDVLAEIRRRVGTRRVQAFTVRDAEAMFAAMHATGGRREQGLSIRSVRAARTALAQVMDDEVRHGTIFRNPVRGARLPRAGSAVPAGVWTVTEWRAFRETADGDPLAAAWRLSLCGLRRSEVLGLRWTDVDFEHGTVTITQGRVAVTPTASVIDAPKSRQSARTVPVEAIAPGTVSALRALRKVQARDRLAAGSTYEDTGLVAVDSLGRPIRPEAYSDAFRALCRQAGVRVIRLHSTRHTVATLLASLGVPHVDAASLLGHSVEMYLNTYVKRTQDGTRSAAAALGQALSG